MVGSFCGGRGWKGEFERLGRADGGAGVCYVVLGSLGGVGGVFGRRKWALDGCGMRCRMVAADVAYF